jgi:hypothetical protein
MREGAAGAPGGGSARGPVSFVKNCLIEDEILVKNFYSSNITVIDYSRVAEPDY